MKAQDIQIGSTVQFDEYGTGTHNGTVLSVTGTGGSGNVEIGSVEPPPLDFDFGAQNIRNAVDRAMYRLARENGFVRPSAGLQRGSTGNWERAETEYFRRSRAKAII